MAETYGDNPVTVETEDVTKTITNVDGDSIVDVKKNEKDDDWMYKLGDVVPKLANVEGFNNFNRAFTTMGELPSEEQAEKLKPILEKLYTLGFTLRCKDTSFSDEFYSWTAGNYKRNEYYITYKKKGIPFTPLLTEVSMDSIAIALEAKMSKFPNTDIEKVNRWKDMIKQMLGLNAHIALGVNLESPLSFLILNTPGGEEPGDRIDFDTIGFNTDILLLAGKYNIPTFNLNKEGAFTRLEEFINGF